MAKLQQTPCCHLVITRDGGGITADHVLRQGVHLNAALIQVLFDPVPIPRLAQVFQEMAQPVVTKIQRFYGLSGEPTQGVFHALDVGFNRHLPVIAFRENMRQPQHCRPPPTEPPLLPMAGDMPVQDLRQAHLDHLTDEECHIVDPLGNDHQFTFPKDLLGLLTQLNFQGVLSSIKIEPIRVYE
jgi:hypothetical protein